MSWLEILARIAVPLLTVAAIAAFGHYEADRSGALETTYLAALTGAILVVVSLLSPAPAWELGLGATFAVTLLWTLPDGPGRGAALGLLLTATLAVAAGRRLAATLPRLPAGVAVPLALGLQVLLRGDLLLAPKPDLRTVVLVLVLPVVAGGALSLLARRHDGELALLLGAAVLLWAGGWTTASTLILVSLVAVLALASPLSLAALAWRRSGPGLAALYLWIGALLFGSCLLAGYPWLRPHPLATLFGLVGPPRLVAIVAVALVLGLELVAGFRLAAISTRAAALLAAGLLLVTVALRLPPPGVRLLPAAQGFRLDAAHPTWEAALPGGDISGLAVESVLANSVQLAAEAPVATIRLLPPSTPPGISPDVPDWTLRAGRESGEWAARRPDVARELAAAGKPVPAPWQVWVEAGFFAQRYRAALPLSAPGRFARIRIERLASLPPNVEITVQQVEVER